MAFPFYPMTNEMLKKLSPVIQSSDSIIKSPELPFEFETHEIKSTKELNPKRSETDQHNHHTNIH